MTTQVETAGNHRVIVDLDSFDRIRERSSEAINSKIEQEIEQNVRAYGAQDKDAISRRIEMLDREWDIDRALMAFFASVGSAAWLLAMTRNRKWMYLLGFQLPFLYYHAATGWCPPMALLRRLGFRSSKEIDAEKYALKTIRGDFTLKNQLLGA